MCLGACKDDDNERERDATQQHWQVHDMLSPAFRGIEIRPGVAHTHRGLTLLPTEEIPQHVRNKQQQQQEIFFIREFQFSHYYI